MYDAGYTWYYDVVSMKKKRFFSNSEQNKIIDMICNFFNIPQEYNLDYHSNWNKIEINEYKSGRIFFRCKLVYDKDDTLVYEEKINRIYKLGIPSSLTTMISCEFAKKDIRIEAIKDDIKREIIIYNNLTWIELSTINDRKKEIKRIAIIGGPGSGKSTLAPKIKDIYNLPVIHLDSFRFKANWEEIDKETRDENIREAMKQERWIIEGVYLTTLKERLQLADIVIWLDYSNYSLIKGVLKRNIQNFNKYKAEIPGCKERIDIKLLKKLCSYKKKYRKNIVDLIDYDIKNKMIVFKNQKDLNNWIKGLKK